MTTRSSVLVAWLMIGLSILPGDCLARGFGGFGGGFRGGGFSGGGFRGGESFGGGFRGGEFRGDESFGGGLGGGGFRGGESFGGALGGGGFRGGESLGGEFRGGGLGGGFGGRASDAGLGAFGRDSFGDRYSGAPSRGDLNHFLGLPSDEGFQVNRGVVAGPRGGYAAGATIEGPRGGEAGRGIAVSPQGGVAAGRGVVGPRGSEAGQGIVAGPGGRVVGGAAVRGPGGGIAVRGFAAGPGGYAAGFARVSPSARYTTAVGVRGNFTGYGLYRGGWYTTHPGAWYAAGWGAGAAWQSATWASLSSWLNYYPTPTYYDYGNTVVYQDNSVYVNGQNAGTAAGYYDQSMALAKSGADAIAPAQGDWLPLGVFAFSRNAQTDSEAVVQLAINQQGIVRGNYTDTHSGESQEVHGSLDKTTQRAAFTVGKFATTVFETGLYNLTKDESPLLVHYGQDRTEQWLLVRLKDTDGKQQAQ